MIESVDLDFEKVSGSVPRVQVGEHGSATISPFDVPNHVKIIPKAPGMTVAEFRYLDEEPASLRQMHDDSALPGSVLTVGAHSGKLLRIQFPGTDEHQRVLEVATGIHAAAERLQKVNQKLNFLAVAIILRAIGSGELTQDVSN